MKDTKAMKIVILVAIIIIPIMYSFFYLKAFWDPYGNLKDMKVAIVNLDEGENNENLGNDLVNNLKEKDVMTFTELKDKDKAYDELVDGKYYATITIPKDFTTSLNNADKRDRKTVTLTYSPNQKSNYLASQIIAKVVTSVESELKGQISQKTVSKLSDKLNEVPDSLQKISDGSAKLQDGALTLQNAMNTLLSGTNTLKENYTTFDNGVTSCYDGSTKLNNGIISLSNGINSISDGVNTLNNSTKNISTLTSSASKIANNTNSLSNGISSYVDTVNNSLSGVSSQVSTVSADIQKLLASNPELYANSNFQKLLGDLNGISTSTSQVAKLKEAGNDIKANTSNLNTAISTFSSKAQSLNNLQAGVSTLANGVNSLKSGSDELVSGSADLNQGLNKLNGSSKQILDGINTLNNGASQISSGNAELVNGITTFKDEIDTSNENTKEELKNLDGLDEYVKNPVSINEEDFGKVSSYGVGFAPYFMSISLWVGGLILIIVLYFDPDDRFKKLGRNANNKFLRTALYAVIGVAQGIVLGVVLKLTLGFSTTNLLLYYLSCVLISLTFLSIIHFLLVYFKDVGKFLSILFLVLQLAASGGTFPIETVPKAFQAISPFMPMTYSVRLVKECIITANSGMIIKNVIILASIMIFFFGISFIIDLRKKNKTKENN